MNSESKHPLSDSEREITKAVVRRFIERDELTTETDLMIGLKPFRASISESLRSLVDRGVLYVVNNTYTQETYAPRAIAFHYCGDAESLKFAKHSTELILNVIHNIVDRDLDSGSRDPMKEYTGENVLTEARTIDANATPEMVRVGLALAEEFSLFHSFQRNPQHLGVVTFRPNRRIFQIESSPWEEHIRRSSVSVERAWERNQTDVDNRGFVSLGAGITDYLTQDNHKVFLVHGHAEEPKQNVATFLRTIGLDVIILHEQAN